VKLAITGASGWLGKNFLEQYLKNVSSGPTPLVKFFANADKEIELKGKKYQCSKLNLSNLIDFEPSHLIHLAFNIRGSEKDADNLFQSNIEIINTITRYLEISKVQKIIFTGSGAENNSYSSDKSARYAEMKLKESQEISQMCVKKGINYHKLIIWSCSGGHSRDVKSYFFLDFINKALKNLPIEIKSSHRVYRSFTSAGDIASMGLRLLKLGGPELITCAKTDYIEIEEFAERVIFLLKSQSLIHRPPLNPGNADENYYPLTSNLEEVARKLDVRLLTLDEQIIQTSKFLENGERDSSG
jgi:nucleoside-diphosphate-sugar epimerase